MKKRIKTEDQHKTAFNSASLIFSVLAVLLIAIGIYLYVRNEFAVGISQPGRNGGGGGTVLYIPGHFIIALGIFFAAFPIVDLIGYIRR